MKIEAWGRTWILAEDAGTLYARDAVGNPLSPETVVWLSTAIQGIVQGMIDSGKGVARVALVQGSVEVVNQTTEEILEGGLVTSLLSKKERARVLLGSLVWDDHVAASKMVRQAEILLQEEGDFLSANDVAQVSTLTRWGHLTMAKAIVTKVRKRLRPLESATITGFLVEGS